MLSEFTEQVFCPGFQGSNPLPNWFVDRLAIGFPHQGLYIFFRFGSAGYKLVITIRADCSSSFKA
jgi:hypothetical protein